MRLPFLLIAVLASAACAPTFEDPPWLVTEARVVAVVAEPPEARPGATVRFLAVVAAPDGEVVDAQVDWSPCSEPKPFTENGSVSPRCLDALPVAAQGPEASLGIARNACALFGPDTPPGDFRPRDPDATGGYYQPVKVGLAGATSFAFERLRCNPAGVSNDVAREFAARYSANRNPVLADLSAHLDGNSAPLDRIPAGADLSLRVRWPAESAETFPVVDLETLGLADRQERLQVSWFVTSGRLSTARTGNTEGAASSENRWRTPEEPGSAHVWAVLRDSRGGAAVASRRFEVGP